MKGLRFHRHSGLISSQGTIKLIPYLKIQAKLNSLKAELADFE